MDLSIIMNMEIDVLCSALVIFVGIKSFSNMENRESWQYFKGALLMTELVILTDALWLLMEKHVIASLFPYNYIINYIYFAACVGIGVYWFLFAEYEIESALTKNRRFLVLATAPYVVMLVLFLISCFNGCVFVIGIDGSYRRGPLAILAFGVPCAYLLCATMHLFGAGMRKENFVNKRRYTTLALYSMVTVLSYILQYFIIGTPIPVIGLTIASFLVYINTIERMISLDPLTRLNNRFQLVRHLTNRVDHLDSDAHLQLMMLDVDRFKSINDSYGHVEGDKALMEIAELLRKTAAKFGCFVARYGGDEFVIVNVGKSADEVEEISDYLNELLEERNRSRRSRYSLYISIGAAEYDGSVRYIPDFIDLADRKLYEVKRVKKENREHVVV